MDKYLEEGELSDSRDQTMLYVLATIRLKFMPMLCGTAFKNKGVQRMLDAVIDFLPSPVDIPPVSGTDEDEEPIVRHANDEEKLFCFGIQANDGSIRGPVDFRACVLWCIEHRRLCLQPSARQERAYRSYRSDARQQA